LPVAIFRLSIQSGSGINKRTNAQTRPARRFVTPSWRAGFPLRLASREFCYSFLTIRPMTTLRVFVLAVPLVVGFFLLRDLVREFAPPKR
jgi:hypothetical protein